MLFVSIILATCMVHCLKISKSNTLIADNELSHLRSQLLVELVNQLKESISIGRSCHEQLRLPSGKELVESGQNLLFLIKSRESDFGSIFGETPEIVDRIVSSIEQKAFLCNAEGNRQLINRLLKVYSRPLFHNETVNITSLLEGSQAIMHNLTSQIEFEAAKSLFHSLSEQIDESVILANRFSMTSFNVSSRGHQHLRPSHMYYYMLFSKALSNNFLTLLANLYHFSSMMWQVYIQENPKTAFPLNLSPLSMHEQKGLELFLQDQQLLQLQPFYQVYYSKLKVKSKSSSYFFYVNTFYNFVLKIDNGMCADQAVSTSMMEKKMKEGFDNVDLGEGFICQAHVEESSVIDIYLYILPPHLGLSASSYRAGDIVPPRILAAKENTKETLELKLKRFYPQESPASITSN